MNSSQDWKVLDAKFSADAAQRLDDSMPEPLFESPLLPSPKVCLRCGQNRATSLLYSPLGMKPILPLCANCAVDWNNAGYRILKGMDAKILLWRLLKYKLAHPVSPPSIVEIGKDLQALRRWTSKMQRLKTGDR
jgi:hypothetical protein